MALVMVRHHARERERRFTIGALRERPAIRTRDIAADDPRGWRLGVKNATTAARSVWVQVVCVNASNATIASGSTTIQPGQYGLPAAWCPSGRVVTGGGWSTSTPNQWVIASTEGLRVIDTAWVAWLFNPGSSPVTGNARAVCISLN